MFFASFFFINVFLRFYGRRKRSQKFDNKINTKKIIQQNKHVKNIFPRRAEQLYIFPNPAPLDDDELCELYFYCNSCSNYVMNFVWSPRLFLKNFWLPENADKIREQYVGHAINFRISTYNYQTQHFFFANVLFFSYNFN